MFIVPVLAVFLIFQRWFVASISSSASSRVSRSASTQSAHLNEKIRCITLAFSLKDSWVWDFWIADDGDTFHMHATSTPPRAWAWLRGTAMPGSATPPHRTSSRGNPTGRDRSLTIRKAFDATSTWTGSVVQGPDGVWRRSVHTGAGFFP